MKVVFPCASKGDGDVPDEGKLEEGLSLEPLSFLGRCVSLAVGQ